MGSSLYILPVTAVDGQVSLEALFGELHQEHMEDYYKNVKHQIAGGGCLFCLSSSAQPCAGSTTPSAEMSRRVRIHVNIYIYVSIYLYRDVSPYSG